MTSNFVYTPHPQNSAPIDYRNSPYLGHFYDQTNSPFIPPQPLSLNPSPFHSPYGTPVLPATNLPSTPNLISSPLPGSYSAFSPFPTSGDPLSSYQQFVPQDPWPRERRYSWNEQPAPLYRPNPVRQRTRSFNDNPYPLPFSPPGPVSPYGNPFAFQPVLGPVLHPYLDGSRYRGDIVFDFAAPEFRPMRVVAHNQIWPLSHEDLAQLATEPRMYKLKISCDIWIPEWPLNFDFRSNIPYDSNIPPIKLGDILTAIYWSLHKRISQYDWAQLSPEREYAVSKAYTRRCKAMGPDQLTTRNQGVKQIDFLMGRTKFRGLAKVGDSPDHLKLLVD